MFYQLTNTATRKTIEEEFKVNFEFPKLYSPSLVINGLEESNLPIITMENPSQINYSIWGLLPESLEDNWEVFQKLTNTLNINIKILDDSFYGGTLSSRRCLVITTGFFTYAVKKGKMYPYHVYLKDRRPFSMAGVYNRLDDGFLTCSILIKKTADELGEIPNLLGHQPVVIGQKDRENWLNKKCSVESLKNLMASNQNCHFHSDAVSNEFCADFKTYEQVEGTDSINGILKIS